jgi:hypothetical protein
VLIFQLTNKSLKDQVHSTSSFEEGVDVPIHTSPLELDIDNHFVISLPLFILNALLLPTYIYTLLMPDHINSIQFIAFVIILENLPVPFTSSVYKGVIPIQIFPQLFHKITLPVTSHAHPFITTLPHTD